jgi:hypothetical protein
MVKAVRRIYDKMRIDWTVSVPTIASAVAAALFAYFAIISDIRNIDTRLRYVESNLSTSLSDSRKIGKIESDIEWIRQLLDKRRSSIEELLPKTSGKDG